jgi:hypothetical protein
MTPFADKSVIRVRVVPRHRYRPCNDVDADCLKLYQSIRNTSLVHDNLIQAQKLVIVLTCVNENQILLQVVMFQR